MKSQRSFKDDGINNIAANRVSLSNIMSDKIKAEQKKYNQGIQKL
jgi:hypothetical protein